MQFVRMRSKNYYEKWCDWWNDEIKVRIARTRSNIPITIETNECVRFYYFDFFEMRTLKNVFYETKTKTQFFFFQCGMCCLVVSYSRLLFLTCLCLPFMIARCWNAAVFSTSSFIVYRLRCVFRFSWGARALAFVIECTSLSLSRHNKINSFYNFINEFLCSCFYCIVDTIDVDVLLIHFETKTKNK